MLNIFPRHEFQKVVNRHQGDRRVRKLRCWDQFVHLLYAQLSGRESMRDLVFGVRSFGSKLYHLGARVVHRSTLSDANNRRTHEIYQDIFFSLSSRVSSLAPKYKLKLPRKLYILDSTFLELCLSVFPWARFRKAKGAVKIHTLLQADGPLPRFVVISDGKKHDAPVARQIVFPERSFLVFDMAYHDFSFYNDLNNNKITFVTRLKSNAQYWVLKRRIVDRSTGVTSDHYIEFTGFYTHNKYPRKLRRIRYSDPESGKAYIFLTNNFKLSAKKIADIYKARWEIELFFKCIKQNLKIKKFFGTTPNAVFTQIWIAMIAYLLASFYKFMLKSAYSIQSIFRLLRSQLFEKRDLKEVFLNDIVKPHKLINLNQLNLSFLTGH
jgi:putative transposase